MKTEFENLGEAVCFLPERIKQAVLSIKLEKIKGINEIRLKKNSPIMVIGTEQNYFLSKNGELLITPTDFIMSNEEMNETVRRLCNYSAHSFQNEMINGFITLKGGHRVGIAASAVLDSNGNITAVKNISSLNIRIARQIILNRTKVFEELFNKKIKSVLIIGEPASGKTTFLREIAYILSSEAFGYKRVCIIDERKEIAINWDNFTEKTDGLSIDVLDGYPKSEGMNIALRSLSPEIIICDEISAEKDVEAVKNIANAGAKIISTIHSDSIKSLENRPQFLKLMKTCAFDIGIILEGRNKPGEIKEIVSLEKYWR